MYKTIEGRTAWVGLLAAGLALAACATVETPPPASTAAPPGAVSNYWRASLYPARVRAIQFRNSVLDANNTSTWGTWTVSFGYPAPRATYLHGDESSGFQLAGLSCSNREAGTHNCRIIGISGPPHPPGCWLEVEGNTSFGIRCPYSIAFE